MREAIATGKTVEEALENAYRELGVERDRADFEILERPKKSLFGLRVTPARVRVFMEEPPVPEQVKPEKKVAEQAPKAPERPIKREPPAPRPQQVKPPQKPQPAPKKPETKVEPALKPVVEAKAPAAVPLKEMVAEPEMKQEQDPAVSQAKVDCAIAYLQEIFQKMGLEQVEIAVKRSGDAATFTLSGDGLGVLIGRRGETLDALQYLAGLVANRLEGDYFRITIDSGNYREKRVHTLEQLAKKLAAQVAKTGRNLTLEPMNPYERRIIHSTVQTIDGVTSSSIGEEPNRRVVISSTNARKRYPAKSNMRSGRGGRPDGAAAAATEENKTSRETTGVEQESRPPRPVHRDGPVGGRPPRRDRRPSPGGNNGGRRAPMGGSITTRSNAFTGGGEAAKRIDDSAIEIEPPVRNHPQPAAAPVPKPVHKTDAPSELVDKPLYSKIDLDD